MSAKLDEKDIAILTLIQENSKLTANQISKKINAPITTVFAKIKRMEEVGIITQYRAILSPQKFNFGTAAFILAKYPTEPKTTTAHLFPKEKSLKKLPDSRSSRSSHNHWRLGSARKAPC